MQPIQFTDSMTVLAFIALALALVVAAHSGRAAYKAADSWRRAGYTVGAAIGLYTAAAYYIVLFVEPLANVAWLRPAILAWMLHFLMVMRVMATVITTSPSEQVRRELAEAKHKIINLSQGQDVFLDVMVHYQASMKKLEAAAVVLNEKYTGSDELVLNLRHDLTNMVIEQMELKEKLVRAKYEGAVGGE